MNNPALFFQGIDTLGILLIFLALHLLIGAAMPYRSGYRPFLWNLMWSAGVEIDRRLNRSERGDSERFVRGFVVVAIVGACGLVIGEAAHRIAQHPYGWIADVFLLFMCVSAMAPLKTLRAVERDGAVALQPYVIEDISRADQHTVFRKALEWESVALTQYFIGPVLFFAVFQSVGLALYVTFMALYNAFGREGPDHLFFGGVARRVERAINFIPAVLTAALMAVGAVFVSKGGPVRALDTILKPRRYWPKNAGMAAAALAGALGVTLGGPVRYDNGHLLDNTWIGPKDASAKITVNDIKRGAVLHFVIFLCVNVIICAIYIFS